MAIDKGQSKLSEDFRIDYEKFASEFDELYETDRMCGDRLELMAKEFMVKYKNLMDKVEFTLNEGKLKNDPKCHGVEVINEDFEIMKLPVDVAEPQVSEDARFLAQVYRRACQGCHFRVTYNKARKSQENDRGEPVQLARFALRFNPYDFDVCYWYMAVVGWQLDVMVNPRLKAPLGRAFGESCRRSIKLRPEDPLAYHLLGVYYYNLASLSWLERQFSDKLLGCKMDATYEDAERELLKAHSMGDWAPSGLWLARVALARKRPLAEVKKWIDFGLGLECREPSAELDQRALLELRAKLKLTN